MSRDEMKREIDALISLRSLEKALALVEEAIP